MRVRAVNLATAAASLIAFTLVCELFVFRFVLLPSDAPANAFIDGVMRHRPGQTGVYRVANEIAAPFAINAQGWNSGHADYPLQRRPGISRIAVVGDSYVEALQVPHDGSLAERLESLLGSARAEVYRFAVSGAPLSQYVHMVEREVVRFAPDVVVVVLIHNDFDESFRVVAGRYTGSFLKLRIDNGRVAEEIAPAPYRATWKDALRRTALARYFYYRWRVTPETVLAGIARLIGAGDDRRFEANVDAAAVHDALADVRVAADHAFRRLKGLAERHNFRLLLMMDGVRGAIYQESGGAMLDLNLMAAEVADRHGLAFVDLHAIFAADWVVRRERFEFAADGHWNGRGHQTAAEAVYAWLNQQTGRSN